MMVWKMIFLFQGCILRFHVNLPGCILNIFFYWQWSNWSSEGDHFLNGMYCWWGSQQLVVDSWTIGTITFLGVGESQEDVPRLMIWFCQPFLQKIYVFLQLIASAEWFSQFRISRSPFSYMRPTRQPCKLCLKECLVKSIYRTWRPNISVTGWLISMIPSWHCRACFRS